MLRHCGAGERCLPPPLSSTGSSACGAAEAAVSQHALPRGQPRRFASFREPPGSWLGRPKPAQQPGKLAALQVDLLSLEATHHPLSDWLARQGVSLDKQNSRPVPSQEGLVLATQRSVPSGQRLVSVPEAAWITPATVQGSRIGPAVEGLEPWVRLALFLLHERSQPGSQWGPYLDSLPDTPGSPLFWSDAELAELEGSQVLASVVGYRQFFEGKYTALQQTVFARNRQLFPEAQFGYSAFLWAVGIVRARVHAPLEGDSIALVPMADLVSHKRGAPSSWTLSGGLLARPRTAGLVATRDMRAGELVCMDFGPEKLDSQLLLDYGVVDSNSAQGGFLLTLSVPEGDKYHDDKVDVLEVFGLEAERQFVLRADAEPGEDLLGYLRLINLQGADCFLLESLFRNEAWGHMLKPVSEDNEAAVFESMMEGCAAALSGYQTSLDDDLQELRRAEPGSRRAAAIRVRLGEKEALDGTLRFFEERRGRLRELEFYQERRLKRLGLLDDDNNSTYDAFFRDGIA